LKRSKKGVRDEPAFLYREIYARIREAILGGQMKPGERLASTRTLAAQLGVSRNSVLTAIDQLTAEGFLHGRRGSGTFVATELIEVSKERANPESQPSKRGRLIASTAVTRARRPMGIVPFTPGLPDLSVLPLPQFGRILTRQIRSLDLTAFSYGASAGHRPLRESLAVYLRLSRGVVCTPEQVLIVSGSQSSLDLCARVLFDSGDTVCVEDPGYLGARGAFVASGLIVAPISVDEEGAKPDEMAPKARGIYVTPSHQFPLGMVMSLRRRLELLARAKARRFWIIEDDYDSEFRFAGKPISALQGLDRSGRVIYTGTFSKVLFPGLRTGYMVVPEPLIDAFSQAHALTARHSPILEQATLAEFLRNGGFHRHIRKVRALYSERKDALASIALQLLGDHIQMQPTETGMQMVGWLKKRGAKSLSRRGAEVGLDLAPVSDYCMHPISRDGFLLGFAAFNQKQIRVGIEKLARLLGS